MMKLVKYIINVWLKILKLMELVFVLIKDKRNNIITYI